MKIDIQMDSQPPLKHTSSYLSKQCLLVQDAKMQLVAISHAEKDSRVIRDPCRLLRRLKSTILLINGCVLGCEVIL